MMKKYRGVLVVLLCMVAGPLMAQRFNLPLDLSGQTIVFSSRVNTQNPGHKPTVYRVYFHSSLFNAKHVYQQEEVSHHGRYVYHLLSRADRIAIIHFENLHQRAVAKNYRCVLVFAPDGRHGEFIYQRHQADHGMLMNAGSFTIVDNRLHR